MSTKTDISKKYIKSEWIYFLSFKRYCLLCEAFLNHIRQNFPSMEPCIQLYNTLVTKH